MYRRARRPYATKDDHRSRGLMDVPGRGPDHSKTSQRGGGDAGGGKEDERAGRRRIRSIRRGSVSEDDAAGTGRYVTAAEGL